MKKQLSSVKDKIIDIYYEYKFIILFNLGLCFVFMLALFPLYKFRSIVIVLSAIILTVTIIVLLSLFATTIEKIYLKHAKKGD